ncbi:MAG TPA: carboxypeptidase-like regulatory domain-containing protein [Candidatus Thermoplasmatota archaeon]|nr:carboxypeptidase-like regulatory domain-containing protein [Candidatus Thermoplasmatota archaeon]
MRIVAVACLLTAFSVAGCSSPEPASAEPVADFTGLELAATATTGVIRGIVVDDAIRPVAGATLVLQTEAGPREATSTADGVFGYDDLAGGTYFIQATKPGYTSSQTSTEVVPGVAEPPVTKILLVLDPATTPYVTAVVWNGFIECSMRAGTGNLAGSVGVNACNDLPGDVQWNNQDVNFPVSVDGVPDLMQGEMIWEDTQSLGSGLSFVVGPHSCADVKWNRADGASPLVIRLNQTDLEDEEDFAEDAGLCYRAFSYTAEETAHFGGLVLSQRFDAYFHLFYNFLPPDGWQFSVDGEPIPPV